MVATSVTFRWARSNGGDVAALFASDDGSCEATKFSELSDGNVSIDSAVHAAASMDLAASLRLGDDLCGVVGRLGNCVGDDGRVGGFGGGIIPLDWSTFATVGRDIAMFGCCDDVGLGARRFVIFGLVLFGDASKIKQWESF